MDINIAIYVHLVEVPSRVELLYTVLQTVT